MKTFFDTAKFMEHVEVIWISRGMSMRDAATACGVPVSTISRRQPSLQNAAALASWSGLKLDSYVLRAALLDSLADGDQK
jgi:hypothetical protein